MLGLQTHLRGRWVYQSASAEKGEPTLLLHAWAFLMTTDSPCQSRLLMPCFATTIFTSAFLLFQVQPLISKFILP